MVGLHRRLQTRSIVYQVCYCLTAEAAREPKWLNVIARLRGNYTDTERCLLSSLVVIAELA